MGKNAASYWTAPSRTVVVVRRLDDEWQGWRTSSCPVAIARDPSRSSATLRRMYISVYCFCRRACRSGVSRAVSRIKLLDVGLVGVRSCVGVQRVVYLVLCLSLRCVGSGSRVCPVSEVEIWLIHAPASPPLFFSCQFPSWLHKSPISMCGADICRAKQSTRCACVPPGRPPSIALRDTISRAACGPWPPKGPNRAAWGSSVPRAAWPGRRAGRSRLKRPHHASLARRESRLIRALR